MAEPSGVERDSGSDGRGALRVLLVDDEPDVAEVTAEFLQRRADAEASVVIETEASAGLDRLESERFDAVVSDYEMPGMDGIEFLERVRERNPELPFILFTGRGSEDLASRAISAGVTDYVQKGSGTDQYDLLTRRVESAVGRRRAERELSELNRINRTIRKTTQRVVQAGTRAEIVRSVCETLAGSPPYLFAWIGEVDDDRLVPEAWAGIERGYLGDVTVTTDRSPTGRGPGGQAVRTGEPQAIQNIREAPEFEPWREAAEERGYESIASIPLEFEADRHGVLNVYADRQDAFDERELDVLGELGATVAHAIHRATLTDRLENQYETLFEESPVMAVTTRNESGHPIVEGCNRRFLERLGYDRRSVTDRSLEQFCTPESRRKLIEEGGYSRALADEFTQEKRTLVTADDETVETLLRAVPREDENGETIGTFALYVDISERERLERENKRLDEFASVVSHDLRNPLTVVKGRAQLAGEKYDDDDVDAIIEAASRMEELIDDLLLLARQGEAVDETRPVRLPSLAEECWGLVDTDAATLELRTDLVVEADGSRLQQLLENLFRNAVEHAPPAGAPADELTVTVGALEWTAGFYVEDDGTGVPPSERDSIFEAGYSTDKKSTGFGLSIVAEIAEAHGWDLSLAESDDGGARFEIAGVDVAPEEP